LGTGTSNEAKDYFSILDKHELNFADLLNDIKRISLSDENDADNNIRMVFDDFQPGVIPSKVVTGNDLINMSFSKTRVEDRKVWLNSIIGPDVSVDYAAKKKKKKKIYTVIL
jgi:hypothetical protein